MTDSLCVADSGDLLSTSITGHVLWAATRSTQAIKCGQLNLRGIKILLAITIPKLLRGTFSTAGLLRVGPKIFFRGL